MAQKQKFREVWLEQPEFKGSLARAPSTDSPAGVVGMQPPAHWTAESKAFFLQLVDGDRVMMCKLTEWLSPGFGRCGLQTTRCHLPGTGTLVCGCSAMLSPTRQYLSACGNLSPANLSGWARHDLESLYCELGLTSPTCRKPVWSGLACRKDSTAVVHLPTPSLYYLSLSLPILVFLCTEKTSILLIITTTELAAFHIGLSICTTPWNGRHAMRLRTLPRGHVGCITYKSRYCWLSFKVSFLYDFSFAATQVFI